MDRMTGFKVVDLIVEELIKENYWDLFTKKEIEPLDPWWRLTKAQEYRNALGILLKKELNRK